MIMTVHYEWNQIFSGFPSVTQRIIFLLFIIVNDSRWKEDFLYVQMAIKAAFVSRRA